MKAFIAMVAAGLLAIVLVAMATPSSGRETSPAAGHDNVNDAMAGSDDFAVTEQPSEQMSIAQSARPVPAVADEAVTSAAVPPVPLAPDFTLSLGNGEKVTLSDLRGNVVILDFWSTWCGPCRAALPYIDQFSKWASRSGKPIKVFAVHTMERGSAQATVQSVSAMWQQQNFSTLVLFDFGSAVARQYSLMSIPQTFIIAPDGHIAQRHIGFDRSRNLTDVLRQESLSLLNE